jgi:hypothetical protein
MDSNPNDTSPWSSSSSTTEAARSQWHDVVQATQRARELEEQAQRQLNAWKGQLEQQQQQQQQHQQQILAPNPQSAMGVRIDGDGILVVRLFLLLVKVLTVHDPPSSCFCY